ncbi:hypothetical protein ACFYXM_08905 [Streptomyces sp. NPDC002476]|uniref:hypothetical protein n=1 Tax=Streptomyces sp. NPDC002476 TaxID=3364648 RepID=UPI0036C3EE35
MSNTELIAVFLWVVAGILAGGNAAIVGLIIARAQAKKKGRCPRCSRPVPEQIGS